MTATGDAAAAGLALRTTAGWGLPRSVDRPSIDRPLTPRAWGDLLERVETENLGGFLVGAIGAGELPVTPVQRTAAAELQRRSALVDLALESTLLDVAATLPDVDVRVLKGPAVAALDYPDSDARSFRDIDLLVPSERLDAAVRALTEAGYARRAPEIRGGFDHRFAKGVEMRSPAGFEVDLHRTLARGPIGFTIRAADLWAEPTWFSLAGRRFPALPAEQRFVHACIHAALDASPRIVPARDVGQLSLRTDLRVDRVRELAVAWGVGAVVAGAVDRAREVLWFEPAGDVAEWALSYRASPSEIRMLDLYLSGSRRELSAAIATCRAVPGTRDKVAYSLAMAFPSRAYLTERGRGYLAHWGLAGRRWRDWRRRSGGSTASLDAAERRQWDGDERAS